MQNQTNFDILSEIEQQDILGEIQISSDNKEEQLANNSIDNLLGNFEELNSDLLQDLENKDSTNVIEEQTEKLSQEIKVENKKSFFDSKIYKSISFFIKYIFTSGTIFGVLLLTTNYSAYIEIARSYLNPEGLEQNKVSLLASVNSLEISKQQNIQDTNSLSGQEIGEKVEMVKNKTFHSMDKLIKDEYNQSLDLDINIAPYENRIIIPKIGKNIPLIDVENKKVNNVKELEDVFMEELTDGIVRYPGSAIPGEIGNSFIFGHSSNFPWIKGDYNDVFALLDNLVAGDEIIVYYNQTKFIYTVREKKVIKPGDVSVLKKDSDKKEISLMTCWPVGTTLKRLLVIGEITQATK